jgi:hypothetical protein
MNVMHGSKHRIATAIAAFLGGVATVGPALADGQLKWTPHRAAGHQAGDVREPAPISAPTASAPTSAATPAAAPAAIVLPDDVPRTPSPAPARPPVARRPAPRPRQEPPQGEWASPSRISGSIQRTFDPANPNGVFGEGMMRTPQGDAIRPVLAPEGRQAVAMAQRAAAAERVAAAPTVDRLGGGIAPRYTTTPGARPRIDRIAMNTDGIPSVMTQRAEVGALDDSRVPARAPAGATAPPASAGSSALPAPSAGGSAPVEEVPLSIESFEPGSAGPTIIEGDGMPMGEGGPMMEGEGGLLMGEYPSQLHVESFYDDPYACEDEEPLCQHSGRICGWLRRFGKPYYGWRWYRDFTASAGVTSFTNTTDLGINGNYGTNEYLNWAMPFWNAFGVGWQVGWRGTQTNFQPASIEAGSLLLQKETRQQNFITTGFFTRAFEGRGLQGGAVYDYLNDNWFDNVDVAQVRAELSYVWGYHELGFWGAANLGDQTSLFGPITKSNGLASTLDLYCGFYRLQFGDANELKVWAGGTSEADGIIGSTLRAPLARSFAMEGTFTYVIPDRNHTINLDGAGASSQFSPSAWNLGVNIVYYPAGRSRRSLASPYRPLFDVADNGSMIRTISGLLP